MDEHREGITLEKKKFMIYFIILVSLFTTWVYLFMLPTTSAALGAGVNDTLNTTVNITNSAPEIRALSCPSPIDLEAMGNRSVTCNVTVYDYDNNTNKVNGTFYFNTIAADAADNKNNHYHNSSCVALNPKNYEMNFTCTFDVIYFSLNGTWYTNISAIDDDNAVTTNRSSASVINQLAAVYLPESGWLDFGDLAYNEESTDKLANVTNAGNIEINVSVQAWGNNKGDSLAMDCDQGSIPLSYERYNWTGGMAWDVMIPVTNNEVMVPNLWIEKQTIEDQFKLNSTYWRLKIPLMAGGVCEGKLQFTASSRS